MSVRRQLDRLVRTVMRGPMTLAIPAVGIAVVTGCSVGAYPIDYFQEMHYSPALRIQEAPSMNVPAEAIAYRGLGIAETSLGAAPSYDTMPAPELAAIESNALPDSPVVRELGAALFQRNCAVCHGPAGDGSGHPLVVFNFPEGSRPADLTTAENAAKTAGALFATVTNGQGTVNVPEGVTNRAAWGSLTNMPPFKKLLTPEKRWAIVWHIRGLQGQ